MSHLVPGDPGGWSYALRHPVALYWPAPNDGYWAIAYLWGSGGRISFGRVGSDCPLVSHPLAHRYWTLAYVHELEEPAMKYLKKISEVANKKRATLTAVEKEVKDKLPALTEYLETDRWPNGDERVTSTLSLFVDAGVYKACLNDRQEELVLFSSADSLWGALEALEGTLEAGTGDWRRSQWSGRGKGQKRPQRPLDRNGR